MADEEVQSSSVINFSVIGDSNDVEEEMLTDMKCFMGDRVEIELEVLRCHRFTIYLDKYIYK